jgi:acetyltransferase-like isoleucine patch superfamily enzyme
MVWGFVGPRGEYLANTRISNQCSISGVRSFDVGDHVFIGHFSVIDATWGLTVGEGSQIGFFTGIFTHSSHVAIRLYGRDYARTELKDAYFNAPVRIGAYCFVGAHAVVLPGSVIGRGSLVAAQAVVKGEFPEFSILAGNPARRVGDTRDLDKKFLADHPNLHASYAQWAGPASSEAA